MSRRVEDWTTDGSSAANSPYQVELNDGSPCEPLVAKVGRGEGELEV